MTVVHIGVHVDIRQGLYRIAIELMPAVNGNMTRARGINDEITQHHILFGPTDEVTEGRTRRDQLIFNRRVVLYEFGNELILITHRCVGYRRQMDISVAPDVIHQFSGGHAHPEKIGGVLCGDRSHGNAAIIRIRPD